MAASAIGDPKAVTGGGDPCSGNPTVSWSQDRWFSSAGEEIVEAIDAPARPANASITATRATALVRWLRLKIPTTFPSDAE